MALRDKRCGRAKAWRCDAMKTILAFRKALLGEGLPHLFANEGSSRENNLPYAEPTGRLAIKLQHDSIWWMRTYSDKEYFITMCSLSYPWMALHVTLIAKLNCISITGVLDLQTRMVLLNAIYFKGLWEKPFRSSFTKDMDFWISRNRRIQVPMMSMDSEFRFSRREDINANVLVLDYKVRLFKFCFFWLFLWSVAEIFESAFLRKMTFRKRWL